MPDAVNKSTNTSRFYNAPSSNGIVRDPPSWRLAGVTRSAGNTTARKKSFLAILEFTRKWITGTDYMRVVEAAVMTTVARLTVADFC